MPEANARLGIDEEAASVRPAMGELRRHGAGNGFERLRP